MRSMILIESFMFSEYVGSVSPFFFFWSERSSYESFDFDFSLRLARVRPEDLSNLPTKKQNSVHDRVLVQNPGAA